MTDDPKFLEAKQHVQALRGFYIHGIVFLCVMALLLGLNSLTRAAWWAHWPLLGWGLGLLIHGVTVFTPFRLFGRDWEQRKIAERLAGGDRPKA